MAIIVPTVETIGDEALTNSIINRGVTELQDNKLASVGGYAFRGCTALKKVVLAKAKTLGPACFSGCSRLEVVDLWEAETIGANDNSSSSLFFNGCNELKSLIIRTNVVVEFKGTDTTTQAKIPDAVYVPANLLEEYKTESPWSSRADTIYAIEDYPEV